MRDVENKIFVYIGEYDEYAPNENGSGPAESKLEKFISPNLGCDSWSKVYYFSPRLNPCLTEFKKHKKIIMSHYHNIEKVKDAEIVGILIGTVVCDNHMAIINYLKR